MSPSDISPRETPTIDEVLGLIQKLDAKMDQVLRAVKATADEEHGNHIERVQLVRTVRKLERRVEALEEKANVSQEGA